MRTTEVFVEQVLIGFLVFAMLGLPFQREILCVLEQKDTLAGALGLGAALVGTAYLCGVVFDRCADMFLDRFVRYLRAKVAIGYLQGAYAEGAGDPFPEDQYRIEALWAGSGVQDWFHYLRSAIRLSRALVMYVPGITLAGVVAAVRGFDGDGALWWGYSALDAAYLGLPLGAGVCKRSRDRLAGKDIPRTDKVGRLRSYGLSRGLLESPNGERTGEKDRAYLRRLADIMGSPQFCAALFIGAATLAIVAVDVIQRQRPSILPFVVAAGGCAFTCLAVVAWIKVEVTYMRYHYLIHKYAPSSQSAR